MFGPKSFWTHILITDTVLIWYNPAHLLYPDPYGSWNSYVTMQAPFVCTLRIQYIPHSPK